MFIEALDVLGAVLVYSLVAVILTVVGQEIAKNSIEMFYRRFS